MTLPGFQGTDRAVIQHRAHQTATLLNGVETWVKLLEMASGIVFARTKRG